jgi:hypothetical protein
LTGTRITDWVDHITTYGLMELEIKDIASNR